MPRYFLELAYKGTAYSGFQIQENSNTIQSEVVKALHILFRKSFDLTGSSRTDAGVHANQNFFHFDTDIAIIPKHTYNLNAILPVDIVVKGLYPLPETAHCRFDAISREYKYFIYNRKNPFMDDRGWLFPYPVNHLLLQQAASILKEYVDFTSFSKRNTQVNNFQCTIGHSEWILENDVLIYQVSGNRFLRGMVRGLVGTMLRVGRELISLDEFKSIIEARDCTKADFSTPAQGLFLNRVNYNKTLTAYLTVTD